MQHFVRRSTYAPFRQTDVGRDFMQLMYGVLHSTLGSYLRDALHEGSDGDVACLHPPRA
jgi:hypothetical protein